MSTFNIYFNGTCIDTVKGSTAEAARAFIDRTYKKPEQCVAVESGVDLTVAIALSKKLHVVDAAFEEEVSTVMADAALTGAARERSGKTVCFSRSIAKGTYGIQVLTEAREWVNLLEGVSHEEAREFMRNYGL